MVDARQMTAFFEVRRLLACRDDEALMDGARRIVRGGGGTVRARRAAWALLSGNGDDWDRIERAAAWARR